MERKSPMDSLTTCELAKKADVNVETLRFYERKGLLPKPPRRTSGYNLVPPDRIIIFRQQHLALGLDQKALETEIRKTVLHELAHHLGIDDARLAELGWA